MAPALRIMTVHAPLPPELLDGVLTAVEGALERSGVARVWIEPRSSRAELTVMAELAEEGGSGSEKGRELIQPTG